MTQLPAGIRLVYPRLRPDGDLDFVRPDSGELVAGLRGTREPAGGDIVQPAEIDVYVVPALAADESGRRLGRGGGAYDRALARAKAARPDALVVALLYDDEIVPKVPAEPHDQLVDVLVTEKRVVRTARQERAQNQDRNG